VIPRPDQIRKWFPNPASGWPFWPILAKGIGTGVVVFSAENHPAIFLLIMWSWVRSPPRSPDDVLVFKRFEADGWSPGPRRFAISGLRFRTLGARAA
jgi:hypothetical protein